MKMFTEFHLCERRKLICNDVMISVRHLLANCQIYYFKIRKKLNDLLSV
jgi:hypothetical protein